MNELIVDNFAGGGGASTGIEMALGRPIDVAINHDPEAIAMHKANHPRTEHHCESVWDVDPRSVHPDRAMGLGWFSPDCTFHSKARGGKPFRDRNTARRRRGLAWTVVRWIKARRPRVIMLENVEEFADWGPLLKTGQPDPVRRGQTFRKWHRQIENLGYQVDMRELRACNYGAPTTRKRLFIVARCDGAEIVFPEESHGPGRTPYRTAAECIDWSLPCPSIFERKKPLADATLRRIAKGLQRYVIDSPNPFIISVAHGDSGGRREYPLSEPLGTITSDGVQHALVAATLINTRNGERCGQEPRTRDILRPLNTVTAQGSQGALVMAFLAKHYGDKGQRPGSMMGEPMDTITAQDHHALVTSNLIKLRNNCDAQDVREPIGALTAGGTHYGEVRAFLIKYYGTGIARRCDSPLDTITAQDRFGLVMVRGEAYRIADIGMRMLQPHELFAAQSFPPGYIIDPEYNGKPLTKTAQIQKCGNSVPPAVARALVHANFIAQGIRHAV